MTRLLFLFRVVQKGVDDRIKKLKVSKCQSTYQRGGSGDVRLCTKFGTFESEMEKGKDDLTCTRDQAAEGHADSSCRKFCQLDSLCVGENGGNSQAKDSQLRFFVESSVQCPNANL